MSDGPTQQSAARHKQDAKRAERAGRRVSHFQSPLIGGLIKFVHMQALTLRHTHVACRNTQPEKNTSYTIIVYFKCCMQTGQPAAAWRWCLSPVCCSLHRHPNVPCRLKYQQTHTEGKCQDTHTLLIPRCCQSFTWAGLSETRRRPTREQRDLRGMLERLKAQDKRCWWTHTVGLWIQWLTALPGRETLPLRPTLQSKYIQSTWGWESLPWCQSGKKQPITRENSLTRTADDEPRLKSPVMPFHKVSRTPDTLKHS